MTLKSVAYKLDKGLHVYSIELFFSAIKQQWEETTNFSKIQTLDKLLKPYQQSSQAIDLFFVTLYWT